MKDYISIRHATSNEDGKEELQLESNWPLWQGIWFALSGQAQPDTKIETYVVQGTVWADKVTGHIPDSEMQFELFECKGWVKRENRRMSEWDHVQARTDAAYERALAEVEKHIKDTE